MAKFDKFVDLTGWKMWEHGIPDSRITVIKRIGSDKHKNIIYLCKCTCGKEFTTRATSIKKGKCKSCGCLKLEMAIEECKKLKKHGLSTSNLYGVWYNMKQRCYDETNMQYKNYGARGIKVCDEWRNSVESFYDWAINNGYEENLTIDRINVNGNYEPTNCRWTTVKEQCNNKTNNHLITYHGETMNLMKWSEKLGVNYYTLRSRINILKWDVERAFETPFIKHDKSN